MDTLDVNMIIPYKMEKNSKNNWIPKNQVKFELSPYPLKYSLYNLVKSILSSIPKGRKAPNPNLFKRLCAGIFQFIFSDQLMEMKIEDLINEGKGIIDITFITTGKSGFFTYLKQMHELKCPILCIEAKNYSKDLKNSEFQQIFDRFCKKRLLVRIESF